MVTLYIPNAGAVKINKSIKSKRKNAKENHPMEMSLYLKKWY